MDTGGGWAGIIPKHIEESLKRKYQVVHAVQKRDEIGKKRLKASRRRGGVGHPKESMRAE